MSLGAAGYLFLLLLAMGGGVLAIWWGGVICEMTAFIMGSATLAQP